MIERDQILETLHRYFETTGSIQVHDDGTISVSGSCYIHENMLNIDKLPVKFQYVGESFNCSLSSISSLEGSPIYVGRSFFCNGATKITSLEHAPLSVGRDFHCDNTGITSLKGCPRTVPGSFDCDNTKITSLIGGPTSVGSYYSCSDTNIKNFEGAPEIMGDCMYRTGRRLESLVGLENTTGIRQLEITWNKFLGLLAVLDYPNIGIVLHDAPEEIRLITKRYSGAGRNKRLLMAAELITAGFPENARD